MITSPEYILLRPAPHPSTIRPGTSYAGPPPESDPIFGQNLSPTEKIILSFPAPSEKMSDIQCGTKTHILQAVAHGSDTENL